MLLLLVPVQERYCSSTICDHYLVAEITMCMLAFLRCDVLHNCTFEHWFVYVLLYQIKLYKLKILMCTK